ncbi:BQ2448_6046 [Microbotryum intermedium]|uniref:BQ2448_6046 protein n=1 Tax=Microbotryum intermedium TaxID=269621 RepID=A0A238FR87_9BASI|nr:BQ2448_6046 [Microbotryum intermedium]
MTAVQLQAKKSTVEPEKLPLGAAVTTAVVTAVATAQYCSCCDLACGIGFQRLHLIRWRVHQRFEKVRVVAPPSIPSALRAFERDFLSRAGV